MKVLAVLLVIVGIFSALYINIYMLITGILDIIHGSSILMGILKIALREFIGAIVAFIFIGLGMLAFNKS